MPARRRRGSAADPGALAVAQGWQAVATHPLFAPLATWRSTPTRHQSGHCPPDGWAVVDSDGAIHAHPTRLGTAEQWTWVFAHLLLHLGFGHVPPLEAGDRVDVARAAANDVAVNRFLASLKLGTPVASVAADLPTADEDALAREWRRRGVPPAHVGCGTAGSSADVVQFAAPADHRGTDWPALLAAGLSDAVVAAVEVAGGARANLTGGSAPKSVWARALGWFVSSYPLLGSVAARLTLIADPAVTRSLDIDIAAVDASLGEVYVNPHAQLSPAEWRFVLAHEMLHASLDHGGRIGGRDPFLWNVAADYVVNGWLVEMGVGEMPSRALHDNDLRGLSVEAVYERITTDLRRYRKVATLRGVGRGDVLAPTAARQGLDQGTDLDDFYRRALSQGLAYHQAEGRGLLPAGLVEEIRALDQPPLDWDAHLARWFDEHVPSPQRRRSYARASRRQGSTPDIPRPGWLMPLDLQHRYTFGVVLDTSGSMDRTLLGKALGAIASYAIARDVPAARVVFCDAIAYDCGYLPVEDIAGRVKVRGRGGTVLQPGIHLLERADDFPTDAPILVITDGECDLVRITGSREHAFLVPAGANLPFTPRGPVFRMR